jgi:hypothetical protein
MPNKTIAMLIVRRLIIFSLRGLAIRAIAAELGVGVKTVVTYQKRIKSSNKTPDELLAMDDALLAAIMQPGTGQIKADPRTEAFMKHAEYYLSELAQKRASRTILFEEYSKQYPNGYKYSKFCYLLAEASAVKNAVVHNEYIPGDKLMFDFAGKKMRYIHRDTGEVIEVPVFIELSIQEKPQAALLNSLPFLANYSYNCAEQLFNRMYAHLTALQLMRKDTVLGKLYHTAIPTTDAPVEHATTALAQETMPWLIASKKAYQEQKALLEVLDTLRAKEKIGSYWEKIGRCQNSDGGLSWFPGGNSNANISFYILARFGSLYWESEKPMFRETEAFINNLIHYCNNLISGGEKPNSLPPIYYYYALSFWMQHYTLDSLQSFQRLSHFREYWKNPAIFSLKDQALLCLATMRYFQDTLHQKAVAALQSIKERAIVDTINGTRWKELADGEDIGSTIEETIVYLLEAFKEAGVGDCIEPGVVQWLLTNKEQHQWKTTTGTAAIISVLLRQKGSASGATNSVKALLPDTTLKVSDGLLDGRRAAFHEAETISPLIIQKASDAPVNILQIRRLRLV